MPASDFAKAVDGIQRALKPSLVEHGFRVRGRTFNRTTDDGLTQVINLQMGPSDPPGTTYFPGLRENLHGLFTVNLGVYIPEVAEWRGMATDKWVQAQHCSIRQRLGPASGSEKDLWWHGRNDADVVADVQSHLLAFGLVFLARFATRDDILRELHGHGANLPHCNVPRLVSAIILSTRGEHDAARALMSAQAREAHNKHHREHVRDLAGRMGLGEL